MRDNQMSTSLSEKVALAGFLIPVIIKGIAVATGYDSEGSNIGNLYHTFNEHGSAFATASIFYYIGQRDGRKFERDNQ